MEEVDPGSRALVLPFPVDLLHHGSQGREASPATHQQQVALIAGRPGELVTDRRTELDRVAGAQ